MSCQRSTKFLPSSRLHIILENNNDEKNTTPIKPKFLLLALQSMHSSLIYQSPQVTVTFAFCSSIIWFLMIKEKKIHETELIPAHLKTWNFHPTEPGRSSHMRYLITEDWMWKIGKSSMRVVIETPWSSLTWLFTVQGNTLRSTHISTYTNLHTVLEL